MAHNLDTAFAPDRATLDLAPTFEDIEMKISDLHKMTVLLDHLSGDCLPGGNPELDAVAFAIIDLRGRAEELVSAYNCAYANHRHGLKAAG